MIQTDLKEAAEILQGALGPQEAPGQYGVNLVTHSIEMGDESIVHLRQKAEGNRGFISQLVLIKHDQNIMCTWGHIKHQFFYIVMLRSSNTLIVNIK